MSKTIALTATVLFAATLGGYLACDADDTQDGEGELTVRVSPSVDLPLRDRPDARPSTVLIVISGMAAHHSTSGWFEVDVGATIDLLAPKESVPDLLTSAALPTGTYDEIRFDVQYSAVEIDRKWYPLEIPSGDQTGFKVHTGFCVRDGETSSLELGWNVDDALHFNEQRGYWLTPSVSTFSAPTCADDLVAPG